MDPLPITPIPTPPESLVGNAAEFPVLSHWHYFNHAGVCPLPRVAADALRAYCEQASQGAYLNTNWYARLDRLRRAFARMISADAAEIALLKNTSEGLATIAAGLDWRPGDRIVTAGSEYPSNVYPWMDLSRRLGVELIFVPERTRPDGAVRVDEAELLAAASHPRTRLLALSHVQYASGQRLDIAPLGHHCRSRNILFCLDAIQTTGVLPVDVRAMHIDFLAADGHKWLLGPEGAGFLYVRRELLDAVRPPLLGWNSVIDAQNYGHYDLTLKPDASRYECGTLTIPAFLSLLASVELLMGVGVPFIAGRLHALGGRLATGLAHRGWTVVSPRDHGQWSGSVAFVHPRLTATDLKSIALLLRKNHRIELAVRESRLRASPHFYNTEAQIDTLLQALDETSASLPALS